ncbi:uncharacterized protein LOC144625248 isoform X3 [Crassostrea virginica]
MKDFYRSITKVTSGHYLQNFSSIGDFIMAICYRERDDGLLLNYEAEWERTSGFHISSTSKPDQVTYVSAKFIGRRGSYSSDSGASSSG